MRHILECFGLLLAYIVLCFPGLVASAEQGLYILVDLVLIIIGLFVFLFIKEVIKQFKKIRRVIL